MKIGIALFSYNRSKHLNQVLSGLESNKRVDKLYIFQDGLKCETHRSAWQETREIINQVTWCKKICYFSDYNKGLAKSIVDGVNIVLEENDGVIVLEDDCVPTDNFIDFMYQCFEKYQNNKNIYSVSGYAWPIDVKKTQYDVYACGRISSWGWGTWKDRWEIYQKDYEHIKKMKQGELTSRNLGIWGHDLEDTLVGNVKGECDSWAVFWALNVISKEGICINPYKSLIRNIGMDGSGVHCGSTERFEVEIEDKKKDKFNLPENIFFMDETIKAFASLYGSYTAINQEDTSKKRILVYGLGNFYLQKEKNINENYVVEAFIDHKKNGWFAGKKIITLNEIVQYKYDKIIIMVKDTNESIKIAEQLMDNGISTEQILLGLNIFDNENIGK